MRSHVSDWCFSFPRVRGDVPKNASLVLTTRPFSPRARGCSYAEFKGRQIPGCFPRVRGDVPLKATGATLRDLFSPRARGCSDQADHGEMGG